MSGHVIVLLHAQLANMHINTHTNRCINSTGCSAGMSPAVMELVAAGKDPKHPLYKAATKIQAQFRGHMVRI